MIDNNKNNNLKNIFRKISLLKNSTYIFEINEKNF